MGIAMSFCPKCGKILLVTHNSAPSLLCPKCGYKTKFKRESFLGFKPRIIKHDHSEIAVIDEKASGLRTFPTIGVVCPECGMVGSETWAAAVGSEGAKSSFTFFKCTSCGYTRRETE